MVSIKPAWARCQILNLASWNSWIWVHFVLLRKQHNWQQRSQLAYKGKPSFAGRPKYEYIYLINSGWCKLYAKEIKQLAKGQWPLLAKLDISNFPTPTELSCDFYFLAANNWRKLGEIIISLVPGTISPVTALGLVTCNWKKKSKVKSSFKSNIANHTSNMLNNRFNQKWSHKNHL